MRRERRHVDQDSLRLQHLEIGGERAPLPRHSLGRDETADALDVGTGLPGEGRAANAAVAEKLGRDPLPDPSLEKTRLPRQRQREAEIGMRVQVDEPGRDDPVAGVDARRCGRQRGRDGGDPIAFDPDIRPEGGTSRAVDDLSIGENQIQDGLRVSGRCGIVRPGARSNGNDPCCLSGCSLPARSRRTRSTSGGNAGSSNP